MRLGIDTGGTYTDAILLDEADKVVASAKALTTIDDLYCGIATAVRAVLAAAPPGVAGTVRLVGLSTTLATNALVEDRGGRAGLVLIGLAPDILSRGGLATALKGVPVAIVEGGHDAFGAERCPLDIAALDAALVGMRDQADAIAVTAAFAVRNPAHEHRAAAHIAAQAALPVTLSSDLTSRLDAPKRALTTLLNARLVAPITRLVGAVERLLGDLGIGAPLMIVRGDGSLMAAATARLRPVETILSGPAASIVGAAHLSGLADAVISDVGGTTTDVAILDGGRPRLVGTGAVVGGHRTMVEAIELTTTGLGGDSEIGRNAQGELTLGPRRLVPLALLATRHAAVLDAMARELEREPARPSDARFAMLAGKPGSAAPASRSQARLLELLAHGPCSLEIVVDREHLGIPFESLTRRGEVLLCGFTPSDAAHMLGLQAEWSRDAAWLGARIEARKEAIAGPAPSTTPESFAAAVLDAARAASARALIGAAWPISGGHEATYQRLADDPLFASVIAGCPAGRPLALAFELDRPVVAVGGPAAIFYDGVPERLSSRLVLPPHFAVCNAIGAVVGDVVVRVERVATRISEERLALYLGEKVVEVADVAAARAALAEDARVNALAAAAAFGAVEPIVNVAVEEDRAQLAGGLELVVEIRARAIASGRPRATTTLSR